VYTAEAHCRNRANLNGSNGKRTALTSKTRGTGVGIHLWIITITPRRSSNILSLREVIHNPENLEKRLGLAALCTACAHFNAIFDGICRVGETKESSCWRNFSHMVEIELLAV
jgi:hypothetical protein